MCFFFSGCLRLHLLYLKGDCDTLSPDVIEMLWPFFRLPGLVRIAQHSVWPAADSSGKLTLNRVERYKFIIRKPSRVTAEKCFGCSRYYGDEATPAGSVFGFVFF